MTDLINKPKHYNQYCVECIDISEHFSACMAQAIQYVWRADTKSDNPIQDYEKALWFVERDKFNVMLGYATRKIPACAEIKILKVLDDKNIQNTNLYKLLEGLIIWKEDMTHDYPLNALSINHNYLLDLIPLFVKEYETKKETQ